MHGPRFGLSLRDGLSLARVVLTPEAMLDGRRIEEFFSHQFFLTEFWFLWSTLMGSLPQHSVIEFRRYINRFLYLFPDLSDMRGVMRTPLNQHQFFIEPLHAWLHPRGVNFRTDTFVRDIGFAAAPARTTVNRLDYERRGTATSVEVAPEDLVLVTTGSQAADLSAGSMTEVPSTTAERALLGTVGTPCARAQGFRQSRRFLRYGPDTRLAVGNVHGHRHGPEFVNQIAALTRSKAGLGELVTLKDSGWVLSLSVFHQPEIIGQPKGTSVWWGYGLYPERNGDFVRKPMTACTGAEILEETLQQLRFDRQLATIKASSICVPCYMPYVNNIWLPRSRGDRPPPVLEGATNLDSSVSTSRFRRRLPSPSNAPSARPGKRFTACSIVAPRPHPSIRASTIREHYSPR